MKGRWKRSCPRGCRQAPMCAQQDKLRRLDDRCPTWSETGIEISRRLMRSIFNRVFLLVSVAGLAAPIRMGFAQETPRPVAPAPHAKQTHLKHVLVIGQTKGFEHDSISAAMVAIYEMGHETGLWDTELRTDTELLTKKDLKRNAKNLDYFDVLVFASTTGELELDESQKKDMLAFVKDDGKGFVGVHAALDTNYEWPEYG